MIGYLPIKCRLNPVKKIIHIPFDGDDVYESFEFQYLESFERGKGYRVIAQRKDKQCDIYEDEALISDRNEDLSCFVARKNKQVVLEIEYPTFTIINDQLVVYFAFRDIQSRRIVVDIKDNIKCRETVDLLDKNGSTIDLPNFLPLVFMYDMEYINKKCKYIIQLGDNKAKIAKFDDIYPKTNSSNSKARYSLNVQIIEFGVYDDLEMMDLSKDLVSDGFKYTLVDGKISEISLIDNDIPFKILFSPALPQKIGKGQFAINNYKTMGKILGSYNSVVNGKKIKLTIDFGKWNPAPTIKGMKNILSEKNVFRNWLRGYSFTQLVDFDSLECTVKWVNNKEVLNDEEIY